MGLFDKLVNKPGSQAKKRIGWFEKVLKDLPETDYEDLKDSEFPSTAAKIFETGDKREQLTKFAALVRVAAEKTLKQRPYDVQLRGLVALLDGMVVQMVTGEGKTLVGAMAAAGYALQGRYVHVVSVNDYLAARDAEWMRPLFELLGVSVSSIQESDDDATRREAYGAEVVYGSVQEIGFDLLRDRFVEDDADTRVPPRDVVIVDEADSVLIDEARVPLVLAGSTNVEEANFHIARFVEKLEEGVHFEVSSDHKAVSLTDEGVDLAEKTLDVELFGEDADTLAAINLALYAQALVHRDVDYLIVDGAVKLISDSRGRVAQLQRWPDGLQAAVEAKEGLDVTDGGRILDQITIQALVGMYPEVCGMTGTALAAGDQLRQFYNLQVSVIEPNVPNIRFDEADRVYVSAAERDDAVVKHIVEVQKAGQPQLVGTQDVAESEALAEALLSAGVECSVLNAKNHEAEAAVVAEAGRPGRVTVSTQMAGRGTDIKLGGTDEAEHDEVVETGGLHVVGVGRFRSQRLDNQLRGRAGRQGDPGSSLFFVSLEDDVVAVGGAGEELQAQPEEDGLLPQKKVQQFVDHCQRVTEGQMLDIHATTWKYNKMIKDQRDIVNDRRDTLLDTTAAWDDLSYHNVDRAAELKKQGISEEVLEQAAREIMLFHLDNEWSEHLAYLDDVRESIHLRAIARESPIDEFHRMSIAAFGELAERAVNKARETFDEVEITSEGAQLGEMGLHKPSATWTYMVNDNPLSSSGGSVMGSIVQMFR